MDVAVTDIVALVLVVVAVVLAVVGGAVAARRGSKLMAWLVGTGAGVVAVLAALVLARDPSTSTAASCDQPRELAASYLSKFEKVEQADTRAGWEHDGPNWNSSFEPGAADEQHLSRTAEATTYLRLWARTVARSKECFKTGDITTAESMIEAEISVRP